MKPRYPEGTCFYVPLRNGGYARGVVALSAPKKYGILGYFFGPRKDSMIEQTIDDLIPSQAVLCVVCSDMGLRNGEWPVFGALPNYKRDEWPRPDVVRIDVLGYLKPRLVRYSRDELDKIVEEFPIEDSTGLPRDRSCGSGSVEIQLSKLI